MGFVTMAKVADIPEGKGKTCLHGEKELAIFNKGGHFYAMENACLHRGGPLGEGLVADCTVVCPWHGWQWDFTTGESTNVPQMKMKTYPARVEGDEVKVDLEQEQCP